MVEQFDDRLHVPWPQYPKAVREIKWNVDKYFFYKYRRKLIYKIQYAIKNTNLRLLFSYFFFKYNMQSRKKG